MLAKKVLAKIKASLLKSKEELQNKNYQVEVDPDGDEVDEIQANIILNVNKQLSSRDKEKLVHIDKALLKIENNIYGICEGCEEVIAEKRLEVNPYFSICISCAEQKEMDSRQKRR